MTEPTPPGPGPSGSPADGSSGPPRGGPSGSPPWAAHPPPAGRSYPPYAYQPPFNLYAILSLVIGAAVLPPLGIYFAVKAKEQIARTGERGAELAQVGFVVSLVLTCIFGLFIVLWCAILGSIVGSVFGGGLLLRD